MSARTVAGTPATPAGPRPRAWRRHRSTALIALMLLLAIAVVVWSGTGDEGTSGRYDPQNAGPDGARAVAEVLDDEGVDVTVARSADAFENVDVRADTTTVLVTSSEALGTSTLDRLLEHADGARVVVVEPGYAQLQDLGISGYPSVLDVEGPLEASCSDPLLDGLEIEVDLAQGYAAEGCFAVDGDAALVERDGVQVFGAGQALTNDQVLRGDNAAVALRLLGQGQDVVWYVPTYDDLVGDDAVTVGSLLPDWIRPGLGLLALVTLLLVLWRARRLGPLSSEPLPVVVKAIETTRSRGRLYRKAGDRGHAAHALRSAARQRAAGRLRLGAGLDEAALVRDVARHVGRPETDITALIGTAAPPPVSDRDLIQLASDLAALDREVRRT